VGPILAWVSPFLLYGFGELIETNCEIERNTRNIGKYQENYTDNSPSKENNIYKSELSSSTPSHLWRGACEICGKKDVMLVAVKVGARYRNMCSECRKNF
ncbi:MAG: hypothetical protein J6036_01835, partial [Clostridia bacterium]|nr:hypothetical protein [Clostridia bacterium]